MLREGSDLRLLRAVHRHGLTRASAWLDRNLEGLSQGEAAAVTGLSRASISTLAKGFRQRGLLLDGSEGLALNPALGVAFGIDIGFEQIRVAVSDLHGQLLGSPREFKVVLGDKPEASIDWLAQNLEDLASEATAHGSNGDNVAGVAISMAGAVDRATGKLRQASETGGHWRVLSARDQLEQRLGWQVPFLVDRDANASALADALWGIGKGVESSLFVKWSAAGVSAAVTFDHQIFRGAHGIAGEIGHAVVRTKTSDEGCLRHWLQDHPPCGDCGRKGCLDTVASLRFLREYVQDEELSVEDLLALARQPIAASDESSSAYRAKHGLETAARCVGRVIAPVVTTLNPRLVILGGKIGARGFPIVGLSLSEGIREGEVTPAIEVVETAGEIHGLTGKTSVRGAIALALLDEAQHPSSGSWLMRLSGS